MSAEDEALRRCAVPNRAPLRVAENTFGCAKREPWSTENHVPVDGKKKRVENFRCVGTPQQYQDQVTNGHKEDMNIYIYIRIEPGGWFPTFYNIGDY